MQRAKSMGIDAFALNIGTDPYTDTQLGYAYQSAENNGMKVFISFDFNWWSTSQASAIGAKVAQYADMPAQLKFDNRTFVSSFAGDGLDANAVEQASSMQLFFVPNFHPNDHDFGNIGGALNWMAWPNNGDNKAPTPGANFTVADGDNAYIAALNGKPYLARELSIQQQFDQLTYYNSCLCLVLYPLRRRSLLQQELGVPL
ncbi:hypothetical protein VTN77DRAFT_4044 [Rasamsonia byssochlamydoides]|uniref:uncharacterized protein n=1 Tax=Rasamsonia byssochlamydoides TaxID=89139 RepID=UPI00374338BD